LQTEQCRAIAAAVFEQGGSVAFVPLNNSNRFSALQSGQVDVLAALATFTMQRDVFEVGSP
jgi:general L-amino acid transport system substrate-binding protein